MRSGVRRVCVCMCVSVCVSCYFFFGDRTIILSEHNNNWLRLHNLDAWHFDKWLSVVGSNEFFPGPHARPMTVSKNNINNRLIKWDTGTGIEHALCNHTKDRAPSKRNKWTSTTRPMTKTKTMKSYANNHKNKSKRKIKWNLFTMAIRTNQPK